MNARHARAEDKTCGGFVWIGQSFAHCDECGDPFWEHDFDSFRGALIPITADSAARCRERWDGL
jgi:hypothetical protein